MMMMAAKVCAITVAIQPCNEPVVNVCACAQRGRALCITCAEMPAERWMNEEVLWVTGFLGG
jgi:formylmethanofuran dehydrogenase subunit E